MAPIDWGGALSAAKEHVKRGGLSACRSLLLLPPWGEKGGMRGACRESMLRELSPQPCPCGPPPSPRPSPPKGGEGAGCDEWKGRVLHMRECGQSSYHQPLGQLRFILDRRGYWMPRFRRDDSI